MLPLWQDAENGIRVCRLIEAEEVEELVRLFERVAEEEGWQPDGALRLWLDRSVYFSMDVKGQIVGGLQLVLPDTSYTLPCQDVWPEVFISSNQCAHVAVLALERAFRGQSGLFWHIAAETWRYCVGQGTTTMYIEVTPRVLPLYQRLGWPLKIEGEQRRHWGEDCYLCTLGIPEVAEAILRRSERSRYYRQIVSQALRVTLTSSDIRHTITPSEALGTAV